MLRLAGELDIARRLDLRKLIDDEAFSSADDMTIDLTEVTYIDSVAIAELVRVKREVRADGRDVRLIVLRGGMIERILRIAGLTHIFACTFSDGTAKK